MFYEIRPLIVLRIRIGGRLHVNQPQGCSHVSGNRIRPKRKWTICY